MLCTNMSKHGKTVNNREVTLIFCQNCSKKNTQPSFYEYYLLWHYRLWSFQGTDTKLERFLAKYQL